MTTQFYDPFLVVLSISIACAILAPILWWILPDRKRSI